MDHKKIKELVHLYACDELTKKEIEIVENHLLECEECSAEYSSMKQLYFAFTENAPEQVGEHVIHQARETLMDTIYSSTASEEISKVTLFDKMISLISSPLRFSISAAAMIVVGVLIGNVFSPKMPIISNGSNIDDMDLSSVDVANVRFLPSTGNNGEVEILYNNVTPVVYKGKFNDKTVQDLLARAIVSGNNPGIKIKSLNAFADQSYANTKPNESVKKALIESLKIDNNAGVRKQALNVLINYPFDEDIQSAFLYVLSNDKNPGMRVMAVNALGEFKSAGNPINDKLFDILSKKAENDVNSFVRLKAANLIEGGK